MRLPILFGAALLLAGSAAAGGEFEAPRVTISQVNWAEAAVSLSHHGIDPPAAEFARLNAVTGKRFPGIARSSVPVLLPIDVDALRADLAAGKPEALSSDKYFGGFRPSKVFLPGPAGYFATFFFNPADFAFSYKRKPTEVTISGGAFVYDLDGPDHQQMFPVKELQDRFPDIRGILREAHVRYAFARFGVPYVVSIQCYDRPPSVKYRSCREAEPVARKFLSLLETAGGTPQPIGEPHVDLSQPRAKSNFTYYSPGDIIPDTGWHKQPGRADYHIYADMRFPVAKAPAFIKSQSFMPWGDCYRTGRTGHWGRKGEHYSCNVNGIPLVFDESAAVNFSYPWRDNFCEMRNFQVGQCPGGYGHQGEDIRPSTCLMENVNADRCLPYQNEVAAVRSGMIWRNRGNLAAYILVNTPNDFVRFRYMHMNPHYMDADGLISGRHVERGEIIGKVGTWGDFKNGTSYHLHFNVQVFTRDGWVWVSPYMTLVHAYERLVGGRGTEIKPGDSVPPPVRLTPVRIEHPAPMPLPHPAPTMVMEDKTEASADTKVEHKSEPVPLPRTAPAAMKKAAAKKEIRRAHKRHHAGPARRKSHRSADKRIKRKAAAHRHPYRRWHRRKPLRRRHHHRLTPAVIGRRVSRDSLAQPHRR